MNVFWPDNHILRERKKKKEEMTVPVPVIAIAQTFGRPIPYSAAISSLLGGAVRKK